jgi:protein subunit release factor B
MAALGIQERDLVETFVRSGGNGGQNVNKVATCVQLIHVPTGTMVKCQTTRHQAQNRWLARELLCQKLAAREAERRDAERAQIEKIRRQKRGRSAGAKRRMLANKSHQAAKKQARRQSSDD